MWTWMSSAAGRKAAAIAAIAIGLFAIARWWGNLQREKGASEGRRDAAQTVEKAKGAEWERREKAVAEREAEAARDAESLRRLAEDVARERYALSEAVAETRRKALAEREKAHEDAGAVPDSGLWDAIREVSGRLAAARAGAEADTGAAP